MSEISEIEVKLSDMIKAQKWTFAKTYAKTAPHEYIIQSWNPLLHSTLAEFIKKYGYDKQFKNDGTFRYWEFQGYKYWHMGVCINREPLGGYNDTNNNSGSTNKGHSC